MTLDPKKVDAIIANYEASQVLDLAMLMSDARVLACQSFAYAETLGDLGKKYRSLYVERKRVFATLVSKFREEGNGVAASEILATKSAAYTSVHRQEVITESSYDKGKLMFKAIEKVLDSMRQEIAELRKEREHQRELANY